MPRRLGSFRSGDWNEELGLTLLRAVAFVAAVPRQEDVGIDAIATLFRKDGKLLIAENTFYVQLKSVSSKSILYDEFGLSWLNELRLPLLFGRVDKKAARIRLYAGFPLFQRMLQQHKKRIRLHFDGQLDGSAKDDMSLVDQVDLREPLLEWDALQVGKKDFGKQQYDILKSYLKAELWNVIFRRVGYSHPLTWSTGNTPIGLGDQTSHRLTKEELYNAFRFMMPSLLFMADYAHIDPEAFRMVKLMFKYMKKQGFDEADPSGARIEDIEQFLKLCSNAKNSATSA